MTEAEILAELPASPQWRLIRRGLERRLDTLADYLLRQNPTEPDEAFRLLVGSSAIAQELRSFIDDPVNYITETEE